MVFNLFDNKQSFIEIEKNELGNKLNSRKMK